MKRSAWKNCYIASSIYKTQTNLKKNIWSRQSTIPEFLIGKYVLVHNGKNFLKVYITREKVGYKFGEFAKTRKFTKKIKKLNANKKKK